MIPAFALAMALVAAPAVVAAGSTGAVARQPSPAPAAAAAAVPAAAEQKPFGLRLVEAARQQVSLFVIYSPAYVKIPYPMGDIPSYQGVCTDVIVRAYRQLGTDLQEEIYESGVGTGDKNIDHRRVTVQAKFFARAGKKIPLADDVKADPGRFLPGDLVTYKLPPGGFSQTHIAVVSDRKTPAGVPLVIHNRGLGVSEEDALFGFEGWSVTGHYRYQPD
jgi:uncharacterized protein YijF (DUF1287 family)